MNMVVWGVYMNTGEYAQIDGLVAIFSEEDKAKSYEAKLIKINEDEGRFNTITVEPLVVDYEPEPMEAFQ